MLGQRINQMRLALGWSQVELAKRLGVAKQTVSNWENENIQPSVDMLVSVAKLFGVSVDFLLGLDSVPRLDTEGLPMDMVAHLSLLISDYKNR